MRNYSNGKIYKLWSDESDCLHIGSTTTPLYKRLYCHKADIKRSHTKTHIDMQNHKNIRIELIEDFPCKSNDELLAREGFHIRENREKILNKIIPGRTLQEYHEEHKEVRKEYRIANREIILKNKKEYYETNKEEILKKGKLYREENKEAINMKRRENRKIKASIIKLIC